MPQVQHVLLERAGCSYPEGSRAARADSRCPSCRNWTFASFGNFVAAPELIAVRRTVEASAHLFILAVPAVTGAARRPVKRPAG